MILVNHVILDVKGVMLVRVVILGVMLLVILVILFVMLVKKNVN